MQEKFIRFYLGDTKEPVKNFEQCTDGFLKFEVHLIYSVVLVSGVQQSDIYISESLFFFFFRFFSHIGYYKILNIVPCMLEKSTNLLLMERWKKDGRKTGDKKAQWGCFGLGDNNV